MLILNDITFNKQIGKLIDKCFELPNVSYCKPLGEQVKEKGPGKRKKVKKVGHRTD